MFGVVCTHLGKQVLQRRHLKQRGASLLWCRCPLGIAEYRRFLLNQPMPVTEVKPTQPDHKIIKR